MRSAISNFIRRLLRAAKVVLVLSDLTLRYVFAVCFVSFANFVCFTINRELLREVIAFARVRCPFVGLFINNLRPAYERIRYLRVLFQWKSSRIVLRGGNAEDTYVTICLSR